MQENIKRIENISGGVLNIQSNVTILQNEVTNLKNIPMIANQSAIRTSSKGTVNQTVNVAMSGYTNVTGTGTANISISPVANLSKAWFEHEIVGTVSGMYGSVCKISNLTAVLYQNYIQVTFTVTGSYGFDGDSCTVKLSGNYQVIEFY